MQSGSTYHAASYVASLSHPSFSWVFRRRRLALITLITVFQTQGRLGPPFLVCVTMKIVCVPCLKSSKYIDLLWSGLFWYDMARYFKYLNYCGLIWHSFWKQTHITHPNHVQIQNGSCHHVGSYCYVTNPKPEIQANVTNYCDIFDQILWPESNVSEILNDI